MRALSELAERTNFHDKDITIRDRLVLAVVDKELSEKLQLTPDLTLKKAIDMARQSEELKFQLAAQRHGSGGHVEAVDQQTVHPRDGKLILVNLRF